MYFYILIEADKGNTLGGSCIRDLWNISNYIRSYDKNGQIYIFTNNKLRSRDLIKFIRNNVNFSIINDIDEQIGKIFKRNRNCDEMFVLITGHGMKSGKDEYIKINDGKLYDDDLCQMFLGNKYMSVSYMIDTCHSGTMLDPEDAKCKKYMGISACKETELASCDIGNIGGFGGSLIIQMIDNDYLKYLLDFKMTDEMYNVIKKNLSVFNQNPVLLYSSN